MLAVSVIIPTFNGAQFIGRTLDSILQQDYPPAEIIVVNDGSTDDTASVVRTYAPGVRLIDIENGGPTGARLTAVRAAKSEWLAFCDSDDLWHPDHLSGLVGLADTHSVPFAFSNFRHVKNGQRADKSHFEADPNFWMQPGRPVGNDGFIAEAPLFLRVLSHQAVFPSCILVHRAFFDRVGGLNPALGRNVSEDLEFTLRCTKEKPTGIIVRPTVDVWRHEQNYTGDWIRTVAGSISILDYARINHDLNQEYLAAVSCEIVSRSIYGIDCCFNQRRFEDVAIFERNLSRTDTPLKTAIKIAVSKQPRFSACLLSTALTAAGNGARLSRLLRHTRAPA